jgi:hypothetical protein
MINQILEIHRQSRHMVARSRLVRAAVTAQIRHNNMLLRNWLHIPRKDCAGPGEAVQLGSWLAETTMLLRLGMHAQKSMEVMWLGHAYYSEVLYHRLPS